MVNAERYNKIKAYLTGKRDNIIEDLTAICRIPSVRAESAKEDEPFGHDCAVCLSACADLFKRDGFPVTVYKNDGFALARFNENEGKSIGLFSHTDVVPANPENWEYTAPFEPKVINGSLVGRGVKDDKSSIPISLYALTAIKALGYDIKHNVTVFLGSAEETGMQDVMAFAEKCRMPDISFVVDHEFPLAHGQKGRYAFNVTTPAFKSVKDIRGGAAVNIVLDSVTATVCLESMPKDAPENITVTGTPEDCRITAVGRPAHASRAADGENALYILTDYLINRTGICQNDKDILQKVNATLSSCEGSAFNINASAPPFGGLTCSNGMAYFEQGRLTYTFDVRFPTAIAEDEIVRRVENKIKALGFAYEMCEFTHVQLSPIGTKYTDTFMDIYRYACGKDGRAPFVMMGSTYAYYLKNAYPIGTFMPSAGDFNPGEGKGGPHMADECIPIDGLIEAAAIVAESILEIDKIL